MSNQEKFRHWSHHRQCLGKQGQSLEEVLKSTIGVYSSHPTAALSLMARVSRFNEAEFYALDTKKLAFRVPAMRQSVYWLPREMAQLTMAACLPTAESGHWAKRYSQSGRKIPVEHYESWKDQIFKICEQPLAVSEIKKVSDIPAEILKPLLNRMAYERLLLRVGAKSLRSNIISYVSTKSWAGQDFNDEDPERSRTWLAKEYVRAFGPVRIKDFKWWAGITMGHAKGAFESLETIALDDDYLLLTDDLKSFEQFKPPKKDNVDLLPQWDCYTMGYAPDGRERFVHTENQSHIYGKLGATGGNGLGTILVNGLAHGTWNSRFKGTTMEVNLNLFEKTTATVKKEITNQLEAIAKIMGAKKVKVG